MQSKIQLLQGAGIVLLAIVQTIAVTTIPADKLITNILVYVGLTIIAITWVIQFIQMFSNPVKIIAYQVHFEINEKTNQLEMAIFMTFVSNTATSLNKVIWIEIPNFLRQKLHSIIEFPIGFTLARYQIGEHIYLYQGKATQVSDEKKLHIKLTPETKPILNELCNSINWNLDYSISYSSLKKRHIFRPTAKEKNKQKEMKNAVL